jgi:hypothetical protein
MKIHNILFLLCFTIFTNIRCEAQVNYNTYKKNKFIWAEQNPTPIDIAPEFKNDDVVYVQDSVLISVGGAMGSITSMLQQRHARLKFQTQHGIDKYKTITIPESFDPLYDNHNTPFKNNKIKKGPAYFEMTLEKFAARIIKANGQIVSASVKDSYIDEETLFPVFKQTLTYLYYKNQYWDFVIENLEPGDELEYYYEAIIPYDVNFVHFNSSRIFFNGAISKQNWSLIFRYRTGPTHELIYANKSEPDSTSIIDKTKYHYWSGKNLYGCIDEPGSRPYESLPYVIYSLNRELAMFRYNDPITAEFKFVPYWLHVIKQRESFDYTIRRNAQNNIKDKQNLLVDSFISQKTVGINDTLRFYKFKKVSAFIADSFTYVNDEALFREQDIRAERIGEFTTANKIREISRQKLYAKILSKIQLEYMTFYVMDNRYGKINYQYQSPIWNTECMYAAMVNGSLAMVHPKKSNFGWYVEELPFYWENTTGLILNLNDFYYELLEKPRIVSTPSSNLADNTRMSNIMATVNLNDLSIDFTARVNLSGQFSTMTRGLYLHNVKDSTNNPLYAKKVFDFSTPCNLNSTEITNRNIEYPFKFDFKSSYKNNSLLTKSAENIYALNMNGWFNHIIDTLVKSSNRQLDYYPDFSFQDTYRYFVKFDKNVSLINLSENIEIKNSFGNLTIRITQPQPDGLLIESYFVVGSEKVSVSKINDVVSIFNKIANLNTTPLLFKVN